MKPDETGVTTSQPTIASTYKSNQLSPHFELQGRKTTETTFEKAPELAIKTPSAERIMYSKIQGNNTATNDIVQGIRAVDETMQQIGQHLNGMKRTVETILKNYPPFPAGNNERISQLRQFSALRKMIDQLTIPPKEEDSPAIILGDRQNHPSSGDWEFIPAHEAQKLIVRQQPLHTGEQGLNVPELPMDASDDALEGALDRLSAASKNLESKRKQFIADANRVISAMI